MRRGGGHLSKNWFDTFFWENKSEKLPELHEGGGGIIWAIPKRKGVFFPGSLPLINLLTYISVLDLHEQKEQDCLCLLFFCLFL